MCNVKIVQEFKQMSIKECIAYLTSIASFVIGFGLIIFGVMTVPIGIVDDSLLFVLGESLSYTGAVLGISLWSHYNVQKMRNELGLKKDEE